MRCEDVSELLSGYIDGALDQDEHAWVEDHLRRCPHCAAELTTLRATLALVQQLDEVEPPADFRVQLKKRILAERRHERLGFFSRARSVLGTSPYRGAVAAVATLALAIGVSAGIQSPSVVKWLGLAKPAPSGQVGQAGNEGGKDVAGLTDKVGAPGSGRTFGITLTDNGTGQGGTGPTITAPVVDSNVGAGNAAENGGGITTARNGGQEGTTTADTSGSKVALTGSEPSLTTVGSAAGDSGDATGSAGKTKGAEIPADLLSLLKPAVGKSAAVVLEVRNFDDAVLKISALAERDNGQGAGYVTESTTSTDAGGQKHAIIRFKTPAAGLQDTLAQIEKMGVVTSQSLTGHEIGADYSDADARLKIYKQQESRYMEILARAKAVDEVIRLENELAVVRTNIELLQGRLDLLRNAIVYSDVSVGLNQSATAAAAPPAGGTLGQAGQEAGKSFLLTSQGLGVLAVRAAGLLGGAAPVLILIGLGWLAYAIYLRSRPERARGRG
ncbi:MAG: DUF4349 domain-containing protein [Bacillota bacterium]